MNIEQTSTQRWAVGIIGLAEYLHTTPRIARALREKGLPARRVGRKVYFSIPEVDRFIEREGLL